MPFQKGNTLGRQGTKARIDKLDALFTWVASGGAREFHSKLATLASKEELSPPEKEFMDRYAPLIEYAKPKLARREIVGNDGGPIQINLVNYKP
ncbi:MAG: hypothetical protein AAB787_01665 [Patescibacteria group bacterium]